MSDKKPFCKRITPGFLKKNLEEYKEWIRDPLYVCMKCGRVARRERDLCKPVLLGAEPGEGEKGVPGEAS